MKSYKYLLPILGSIFLLSCAPDEEAIDFRNQLARTYTYTKIIYQNLGIISETGMLSIVTDEEVEGRLIIKEEATFYGATLNAVDSSFIFYIPEQPIKGKEVGTAMTITGVNNINVGGQRCDAGYFPKDNRLQLYYKVTFEQQPALNYSVSLLAEKQ